MSVVGVQTLNNVTLVFTHQDAGELVVHTGMDEVSWGYTMNTANFPTYGGEVVQILSCYIEDIRIQGTLRNYEELETVYTYFLKYIDSASGMDGSGLTRNESPIRMEYAQRGWAFDIMVKNAPGFKRGRDVVAPQWMIEGHLIDHAGDAEQLADLIRTEAQIKAMTNDDENFGLQGKIRFIDENPFSDPNTKYGEKFDQFQKVSDYYTKLLPSYLNGDFDAIFSNIGSQPSFNPNFGPKGTQDTNQVATDEAQKREREKGKK